MRAAFFPSPVELADTLDACIGRGVAFECTAGLHHAVRHSDPGTGFEHHGFRNLLLAREPSPTADRRSGGGPAVRDRSRRRGGSRAPEVTGRRRPGVGAAHLGRHLQLYASGTISGQRRDQRGSLIELSWGGAEPLPLADGSSRTFLHDGDVATITATGSGRISLREVGPGRAGR